MMDAKHISTAHRGLEAQPGYFILAMILSVLFVLVTWRSAALVNPRVWTLWEDSGTTVSHRIVHAKAVHKELRKVARLTHLGAQRQQESRAMLLRMLTLGLGDSRTH